MAQPSPCPASAPSVLSGPSPTKEEQEQDQEPDKTDKAREQEPEEQQQQQQQLEQEIQHQTEAEHPLSGGACIQQDAALTDVVSTSTIPTSTLIPIATSNTLANDAPSLTLKSAFPGSSATAASVHATVLFAPDQGSTAPSVDPPPPSTPHTNPTEVPPEAPTHLSNGHHGGYPSGYPSGYHNIESTPTPPAPSPSPSVVASATNGLGDVAPSASPSPMSNAPPPPGHPRQHINYAGQATYHQPVMNPAPYGYQVATSQGADPYRGSQPLPPNPALALPSMRSLDSLQQQQQQQQQQHQHHHHQHQQQAMSMTAPIPAQYYSQPAMPMNPYGMHPDYRFTALPMGDPRVALSGGRHKKEIKRRTKTGCLTCRKRRIKCDETQPTCNNCKKSKRECAGYDPIFKQTQQINAPSIQGAPNNQPSPGSASLSSAAANANANLNANTYGSQPAVVSSNYSQPQVHGHPFDPSSLASTVEYHSGGAIDPALDPAKKMKVDELLGLGGPAPPAPTSPPDQALVDEITKIYYEIYVPGLGSFFESTWYNFTPDGPNSIKIIHDNKELVSLFASFLDSLSQIKTTDDPQMAMTGNLEMRVVWGLTTLARSVPEATNPHSSEPLPQDDPTETRARLTVFEALLSGINLTENPCVQPPKTGDPHRIREFEFWFYLAEYLRLHADGQSKTPQLRDTALTRIRSLLDGRENRDVLYSIAILRELSPLFPPGYESQVPKHLDESDPRNRLAVASRFIKDEALTTGGTTNVVRRFAELATKAFITPGVNIARRA